jgi:hypothetical protein
MGGARKPKTPEHKEGKERPRSLMARLAAISRKEIAHLGAKKKAGGGR